MKYYGPFEQFNLLCKLERLCFVIDDTGKTIKEIENSIYQGEDYYRRQDLSEITDLLCKYFTNILPSVIWDTKLDNEICQEINEKNCVSALKQFIEEFEKEGNNEH